jgi:hypothetical protein
MEDFNEKYERVEVNGVTKFRYRKPSLVPDWLRRFGGEDPYANMTPAEINKIRRQQGQQPYSRAEFETFGVDPGSLQRRVPLKGYDEPASSGLSPAKVKELQQAANDARKAGQMSDIRGSETPGSSVPAPAKPYKAEEPSTTTTSEPSQPAPKVVDKEEGMRQWAKNFPELAKTVVKRQERATKMGRGTTQSGYETIKKELSKAGTNMEAYDVVLDYLLSEGHAETVEEAHYVMMQLDSEYIQSIVEAGLPIPPGGIKPDRLNPIDPVTGKSKYKMIKGPTGKPREIENPSFGKLPPA